MSDPTTADSGLTHQLDAANRRAATLVEKNRTLEYQLDTAARNNRRMVDLLDQTRQEITTLKAALELDGEAPFSFATVLEVHAAREPVEGHEIAAAVQGGVDVLHNGRRLRVAVSPLLDPARITQGADVLLNDSLSIIALLEAERTGELVRVKETLDDGLLVVVGRGDEERVLRRADRLAGQRIRVGDAVTVDARTGLALDLIPLNEVQDVVLEEVPDVSYEDIGGLADQIDQIRDSIELPFLYPGLYREHGLKAPKGILLYGPPGTGKTLIAKAVASSLAARSTEEHRSYFLNIKGPELLNKYVGETERHIRTIFARAREKASDGYPVVVFFDEMESLFRTRGSGVSSDVETTIVPQLLAEIDGVERLDNVIVIGASNREDMIDPAILRPGRLDVKIRVSRPDAAGAADIFGKYVTESLPLHASEIDRHGSRGAAAAALISAATERLFARGPETEYLEVTYVDGSTRILHFADFTSGAVIANIVDRAKKHAIKDYLSAKTAPATAATADASKGLRTEHLLQAIAEEFAEQEDLPNHASPEEWARISGHRGGRVAGLRMLLHQEPR
ncbi:proteasome ATPase [Citricoccus nitrophenolicus]|uniref:AAA ATPase forming ring-shaped complexes n=1 Tax=Citricoccus nitrophenolicus TaxID=863575 RepID=A0ABV0IDS7_9MICC